MPALLHRAAAALLALGSLALAACAQTPASLEMPARSPEPAEYRLASGDVVNVAVAGQPELSGKFTIDPSGQISLLHAGAVPLTGRTLREAEVLVADQLRRELRAPLVTINVAQYRPIFVTGEVRNSGGFAYLPGLTVLRAVALAGGFSPRASRRNFTLVREDGSRQRAVDSTPVRPGDTIEVGESIF